MNYSDLIGQINSSQDPILTWINNAIALRTFIGIITFALEIALVIAFFIMCKNVSKIKKHAESEERKQETEKIISQLQNLEMQQQKTEEKANKEHGAIMDLIKEQRKTNELLKKLIDEHKN